MKNLNNFIASILIITAVLSSAGCSKEETVKPSADAGLDQIIYLPTSSVILDGKGLSGGTSFGADSVFIIDYEWTQVSGTAALIGNPSAASTNVRGLTTAGVRVFQLKVFNNRRGADTDSVGVR